MGDFRYNPASFWRGVIVLLLAIAGFCLVMKVATAQAKWKPEYNNIPPEIQAWYKTQHNSRGEWCCNESDGHPYFGDIKQHEDGSVTVFSEDGTPHHLPEYMVLKGPNPTGHAVWWYLDVGPTHRDYCFAHGTLS